MVLVFTSCVDTEQFNLSFPSNKKDKIIICQIGTIQTRYNVHFTFKFLKELNKTYNTKIIFINKNEHKKILDLCKKYNLKSDQFEVLHSDHSKVHEIIRLAKFSIFFSKNGYFKKGFFPTKIAESLSCGIPIITSSINNHIDKIIVDNTFGVLIKDNNNISIKEGIKKIELFLVKNNFKKDMRNFVIKNLSIKYATNKYDNIYKYLLKI